MDITEFCDHWNKPREVVADHYGLGHDFAASKQLAKLLGLDYPKFNHWTDLHLTEQEKHTLKLITGPHGHTIIKMLEARNEC